MAFYGCGWAPCSGNRFDHIGIYGTLSQPLRIFYQMGLIVKNLDKDPTDDLSLFFRITFPCQSVQKALSQGGHRLERLMAEKLGLQPQQIWPERYDEFGTPLRQRGRPALKAVTTTKDSSIAKGDEERAA